MARRTRSFGLRLAVLATALVVGPATLAPGTAEAPVRAGSVSAALAGDSTTTAQRYGWRTMLWDFAWEFGESLDSPPYRGTRIGNGRWEDRSTGTGRVVKWGGGIEFHSGEVIWAEEKRPDFGTTTLTLRDKPDSRGRWETRERTRLFPDQDAPGGAPYDFVVELVPADPAIDPCTVPTITIARAPVGGAHGDEVQVGVRRGSTTWTRTLGGYGRDPKEGRLYGVQITGRRITWFINGTAVASLAAPAAIPTVPLTMRMSMEGQQNAEMKKSYVLIDWVRHYNLRRGQVPPTGVRLSKGSSPC